MTEHAYRCSPEFAAAFRAKAAEIDRFRDDVIIPWDEAHPDTMSLWARGPFSIDRDCVGFTDPGGDTPPEGLSRKQQRHELLPKRGKAGDEWRAHLAAPRGAPTFRSVFRAFEVPETVSGPGRLYLVGTLADGDGPTDPVYLTSGYPLNAGRDGDRGPMPAHLTEIPLSEFYAVKERLDAEREASKEAAA